MGSLPPSKAREFEKNNHGSALARDRIHGWWDQFPSMDLKGEPWSAQHKQQQQQKPKTLIRGKSKTTPHLSSQSTCALTTPISSYTVKSFLHEP
jgi:hypothetical protein